MIELYNEDCMQMMARYPDGYFDLAIVDPPYGLGPKISEGGGSHTKSLVKFHQMYKENGKSWDDTVPTQNYFDELFRISKNQIIWGGNYFNLPPNRGFIVWDKVRVVENFSNLEYAWTSFDRHAKMFTFCNNAGFVLKDEDKKIHPTQKPVQLYRWLLSNYAKEGDKILDTHLGSGSIACACHDYGFSLVASEIDKDYYEAALKRLNNHRQQLKLIA